MFSPRQPPREPTEKTSLGIFAPILLQQVSVGTTMLGEVRRWWFWWWWWVVTMVPMRLWDELSINF